MIKINQLNEMNILVIIPILNPPADFLNSIIPMLLAQSINPKILLINSGDAVPAGEYEVTTIDKKDFNHANTRNIALGYEADYYLFMTQDATPCDANLAANLVKNFEDEDVVVSYARQIPYDDADTIERYARKTNYPEVSKIKSQDDLATLGIKTFFASDSCAMYEGQYFRSIGGFKKDLNTNEDMEFAARAIMAGKKVAYCAEASVYHSHNFSLHLLWNRYQEIGRFFANNQWILTTVSKYKPIGSSGVSQALAELRYVVKCDPLLLCRSIIGSMVKYVAFKKGYKFGHK